jgi:long-chain acyl-CoA synthetase
MSPAAPWLAHYDPGVPATLAPYPDRTLIDYVADAARGRPTSPALLFKGATVSYGELDRLSDACASAFAALGITRGDRVGLLLPNCPQFFIAQFGAWKIGAIAAPLNPIYTEHELEGPLRDHGIETVLTLTRFYQRVKNIQAKTGVRRVIATNIKEFFPPHLRVLFTLFRETRDGDRIRLKPGDHDFAHLLLVNRGRKAAAAPPGSADPAVLLMSGGTTGTPKGVLGTHGAYVMAGLQIKTWNASALRGPADVIFLPLPMFHVYGHVGVQSLSFISGCAMAIVPNPRDLADLLADVRRVKPTFFNGVPTLYIAMLNHPRVQQGKIDFKSIRICFSGAAPLLADTKTRFEALTGARIVEGYSLTEGMMALCVNPAKGENKLGSVGMPLPDVTVCIFDADEGTRELAVKEVGEIAIAAPQLMTGYWHQPEETANVLRDHTEGGVTRRFLHTGDLGYLDEDGYLFIVDRKKDLIKTSGYQVWPREIEETIAAHPAVAEVGVAGIPDATKGEAVKAWVVLRQRQTVSEAELRAFCRETLAPYKVPAKVEFRAELPKTMVGKVLRRKLRDGE